jgi:hypothetical protein
MVLVFASLNIAIFQMPHVYDVYFNMLIAQALYLSPC